MPWNFCLIQVAKSAPRCLVSYILKRNKAVLLLSSKHHDNEVDSRDGKAIIIFEYNKTKGAADTVSQMCHQYSVKRSTKWWPMCVFYDMIDIASINVLIVWSEKNPYWNNNKKDKRRLFFEQLEKSLTARKRLNFYTRISKVYWPLSVILW